MSLQGYVMALIFEPVEGVSRIDWAGRESGLKFEEAYMKNCIWAPLGISNITFHLDINEFRPLQVVSISTRVPSTGHLVHLPDPVICDPAKDATGVARAYGNLVEYAKALYSSSWITKTLG